ncbi:hypothetical protein [Gordonia sp. NPDC003950]
MTLWDISAKARKKIILELAALRDEDAVSREDLLEIIRQEKYRNAQLLRKIGAQAQRIGLLRNMITEYTNNLIDALENMERQE